MKLEKKASSTSMNGWLNMTLKVIVRAQSKKDKIFQKSFRYKSWRESMHYQRSTRLQLLEKYIFSSALKLRNLFMKQS